MDDNSVNRDADNTPIGGQRIISLQKSNYTGCVFFGLAEQLVGDAYPEG